MFVSFVTLFGLAHSADLSLTSDLDNLKMSDVSMVMTHDAATGYMHIPFLAFLQPLAYAAVAEVQAWTKTQTAGFKEQLDCGARAFDVRPKMAHPKKGKGPLKFAHGAITIKKEVAEAVDEIAEWMQQHSDDEVVLLHWSHCQGKNCQAELEKVLDDAATKWKAPGLRLQKTCKKLSQMTVKETKDKFRSKVFGGTVLSYNNCVRENWDDTIVCYQHGGACYGDDFDKKIMDKYWAHVRQILANKKSGFDMVQAHWQYGAEPMANGVVKLSSIIKDEERSQLNRHFVRFLDDPTVDRDSYKIVEVDNVCNHGPKIAAKLRAITAQKARNAGTGRRLAEMEAPHVATSVATTIGNLMARLNKE